MKKLDLINGAVVELRNGDRYILLKGRSYNHYDNVMTSINGGFMSLNSYNENLECQTDKQYDIMKIYQEENPGDVGIIFKKGMNERIICKWTWEREKAKKEMTISEIEKELGYSIKIIKED